MLSSKVTTYTLVTDNNLPSPAPTQLITVSPHDPTTLAPLGRFTTSSDLDGTHGINRASQFCFIQAKNDLEAIEFYLSRYNDRPHTLRAYRKELERFLLWAIVVRGKPLSSLLVDDCEAYKVFLTAPCPSFTGPKAPRFSPKWRPFSEEPLDTKSQCYALRIIRAAFEYLARVRYLGGNPWTAVKDPSVKKEVNPMQIHKALPSPLWKKVVSALERQADGSGQSAIQCRIALATSLLMGDSGLRCEEVATVTRADVTTSPFGEQVYTDTTSICHKNRFDDLKIIAKASHDDVTDLMNLLVKEMRDGVLKITKARVIAIVGDMLPH